MLPVTSIQKARMNCAGVILVWVCPAESARGKINTTYEKTMGFDGHTETQSSSMSFWPQHSAHRASTVQHTLESADRSESLV
eukprot:1706152-Rhodomonas_salina.1